MSSGTGVGTLDDVVNVMTQMATGGTVGFGDKGVKKGVITDVTLDGLKEVTGAKAAEEANKMARDQFEQSTKAAEQDRKNSQLSNQRNQIALSNSAAVPKSTIGSPTKNTLPVTGDVKDFLGL